MKDKKGRLTLEVFGMKFDITDYVSEHRSFERALDNMGLHYDARGKHCFWNVWTAGVEHYNSLIDTDLEELGIFRDKTQEEKIAELTSQLADTRLELYKLQCKIKEKEFEEIVPQLTLTGVSN